MPSVAALCLLWHAWVAVCCADYACATEAGDACFETPAACEEDGLDVSRD